MQHLSAKNISHMYAVSEATARNWIVSAKAGKNNLTLVNLGKKSYVKLNELNRAELERLANKGQKHKPKTKAVRKKVSEDFYKIFTKNEQLEIYNDLKNKKFVNTKFWYKNKGAKIWNNFYNEGITHIKSIVDEFLDASFHDINLITNRKGKINLVDIGPGNGQPIKKMLDSLNSRNLVNEYIGVDISQELLNITKNNLDNWFPKLKKEFYQYDIELQTFNQIFLEQKYLDEGICNVLLFLGNTLGNQSDRLKILKNFRGAMFPGDILLLTVSLESPENKVETGYVVSSNKSEFEWIPVLFGVDVDDCEYSLRYDGEKKRKIKNLVLDKNYDIEFNIFKNSKVLSLEKGEEIVIWNHYLPTFEELIEDIRLAGLKLRVYKCDENISNALLICEAV